MVTTVTLNPCIDYTVAVPGLIQGGLNLTESARLDMSGKGINVSTVLEELGVHSFAAGLSFADNHSQLTSHLDKLNIAHDFAVAPGAIRINIKMNDSTTNTMTEINSRGSIVESGLLAAALDKAAKLAAKSELLVMSGRLPNGAPDDTYRTLTRKARAAGCKVVVDAEGAPLMEAVKEAPYLIKPNLYELEHTFGRKVQTISEILSVCGWIISGGVELVCVSLGERGALIASRNQAFYAKALDITPKGFQGAGDSMVAGICKAAAEGLGLEDMLRFGVAAASGSLIREGTLLCRRADFEVLLRQVEVTEARV